MLVAKAALRHEFLAQVIAPGQQRGGPGVGGALLRQGLGVGLGDHAPGGGLCHGRRGYDHILVAGLAQTHLVVNRLLVGVVGQTQAALGIAEPGFLKRALLWFAGCGVAVVGIVYLGRLRGAARHHHQRQGLAVGPADGEVGGLGSGEAHA